MAVSKHRTRSRVMVVVAVLAAVGLGTQLPTVLADQPEDSRRARSSTSASVAEEPGPSVQPGVVDLVAPARLPSLPEAGREGSEVGATAFVRYWFDTLNYSLAHDDTDALAGVTSAGCQQCTGWLIAIGRWEEQGATLEGGLTSPVELAIGPFARGEPVQFAATFLTTPATVTTPGTGPSGYPGGLTRGGATVQWVNGRWQMTDVVVDVNQPMSQGAP